MAARLCIGALGLVLSLALLACEPTQPSSAPRLLSEVTITPLPITVTPTHEGIISLTPPASATNQAENFTPSLTAPAQGGFFVTATPPPSLTPAAFNFSANQTLSPTASPSATLRPTNTATITPSPTITDTPSITPTLPPSDTPTPTITVMSCAYRWFFQPAPPTCPDGNPSQERLTYQPMERGLMLKREGDGQVYLLFRDGGSPAWRAQPDPYTANAPTPAPLNPPQGLRVPQRGFGLLWRGEASLQFRLGWGTDAETNYAALIQSDIAETTLYISAPMGGVWILATDQTNWTFQR